MSQKDSQQIYLMKFFFIFFMVFVHSAAMPQGIILKEQSYAFEIVKRFFSGSFHSILIGGFFFLSGYLLFYKEFQWKHNIKKKIRTLLIPYIIINTFWLVFFGAFSKLDLTATYFSSPEYQINGFKGVIDAYLGVFDRAQPIYYPFWFLKDLILLNVFAGGIKWLVDKIPITFLLFLLLGSEWPLLNMVSFNRDSVLFFALGYYVVKYGISFEKINSIRWLDLVIVFGIYMGMYLADLPIQMNWVRTSLGIVFLFKVTNEIVKRDSKVKECLLKLSKYGFVIYAFHEYGMAMLKKILMSILPQWLWIQVLEYFLLPIIIMVACVIWGMFLQKRAPRMYKLITGSR